jgi:hypothetical protein
MWQAKQKRGKYFTLNALLHSPSLIPRQGLQSAKVV